MPDFSTLQRQVVARSALKRIAMLALAAALPATLLFASQPEAPARAASAPAFVQANVARIGSGSSVSASFPSANAAGNLIVAYVLWSNTGAVTLTDSRGNTYASAGAATAWNNNAAHAQVFYAKNVAGGTNTVTAAFATPVNAFALLYIHEYAGVDPTNPFDASKGASGASGQLNSGSVTTSTANELLFSAGASSNAVTQPGPGYVARATNFGNLTQDRAVTTAGAYSATAQQNGTTWVMNLATFRAAVAAPATATSTSTAVPTTTNTPVPPTATSLPPTATPTGSTASATPAFVQVTTGQIGAGTAVSAAFPSANTAGNLIVAYVLWDNAGSATLTDSRGNAYASAVARTPWNGSASAEVFYARNIAAGPNVVTAHFASATSQYGLLYIHEYSGIDPTTPIDAATSAAGTGASSNSGALTTANAHDLLFAAGASSDNMLTPTPSYTLRSNAFGNVTADRAVTSTGSYSASASHTGNAWVMSLVAFRAGSAGAPPPPQPGGTGATPTPLPTSTPLPTATSVPPSPTATSVPPPQGAPVFPVSLSSNRRYLVDAAGKPFLMAGDSPQSLIGNLSPADADTYFADRQAHGINTVWINLLCNNYTYCNADGTTFDGIKPFNTPGDVSTPNATYFNRVDQIIQLAAKHNILILLDPAETGGWFTTLANNGSTKDFNYGVFLGNRYKTFPNIVWMSGNDYQGWSNDQDAFVAAVANGIKSVDNVHIHTIELNYNRSNGSDDPNWAPIISLNSAYTYYPTFDYVLRGYNNTSTMPVFMVEANYEFEHDFTDTGTPLILRRQEWWTMTSGATGQLYGSFYTVRFASGWQTNLDTPGVAQLGNLTSLLAGRAWYNLVPDQNQTVVTGGRGTYDPNTTLANSDYATAARTPDGRLVIAYMPTARTLTVDMSKLAGPVTARWYDPASGTFTSIGTGLANSGSRQFTPPNTNSAGDSDWVLVLES